MIMYDYVWLCKIMCIYIYRYIHTLYKLNYSAFFGNPWTHRILCSQKHWEDGAPWDPGCFEKNQLQTWQLEIPKWSFYFRKIITGDHWGMFQLSMITRGYHEGTKTGGWETQCVFHPQMGSPGSSAIAASPVILSDGHMGSGENQCALLRTFVTHPSQWLTGQNVW